MRGIILFINVYTHIVSTLFSFQQFLLLIQNLKAWQSTLKEILESLFTASSQLNIFLIKKLLKFWKNQSSVGTILCEYFGRWSTSNSKCCNIADVILAMCELALFCNKIAMDLLTDLPCYYVYLFVSLCIVQSRWRQYASAENDKPGIKKIIIHHTIRFL